MRHGRRIKSIIENGPRTARQRLLLTAATYPSGKQIVGCRKQPDITFLIRTALGEIAVRLILGSPLSGNNLAVVLFIGLFQGERRADYPTP